MGIELLIEPQWLAIAWVVALVLMCLICLFILADGVLYRRWTTLRFFFIIPLNNEDLSFIACGDLKKRYFKDALGYKLYYDKFYVIPVAYHEKKLRTRDVNEKVIREYCTKLSENLHSGD